MQHVYKNAKEYRIGKNVKYPIVDTINNKNLNKTVSWRQKIKHFNCLYYTIMF